MNVIAHDREPVWLDSNSCSLEAFRALVERETRTADAPLASEIAQRIPIYDAASIRAALDDAALTLQGGVARTDIPIETGPTKLLPCSQTYQPGYFATQFPEFRAYFEDHFAQLPLAKGDAINAVLATAGYNFRQLLNWLRLLLRLWLELLFNIIKPVPA
jgi:hypothetical protein